MLSGRDAGVPPLHPLPVYPIQPQWPLPPFLLCLPELITHLTTVSICQPVCLSDTYSHTTLTPLIPSNLTLSQLPFIISDCIVCCLSSLVLVNPCSFSPLRLSYCMSCVLLCTSLSLGVKITCTVSCLASNTLLPVSHVSCALLLHL